REDGLVVFAFGIDPEFEHPARTMEGAWNPSLALQLPDIAQIHENSVTASVQRHSLLRRDRFDFTLGGFDKRMDVQRDVLRHRASLTEIELLEKVIPLIVDHDESGKILDFDSPDRLHSEFRVFDGLDFLDAVLGEIRGRAADRGEVETTVLFAGVPYRGRTVALGQ